jgi:hypothetical protein
VSDTRVSLCDSCKREWYNPDCGATVKDYEAVRGIGAVSCKKYEPKKGFETNEG